MKKYVKGSADGYVPGNVDEDLVMQVCDVIEERIHERFDRPGRMIDVDFEDEAFGGHRMEIYVTVYVNGAMKCDNKVFAFEAYDNYWDSSDFDEHLNRAIIQFVDSL